MALPGKLRSVVALIVALWIAAPARAQPCSCSDGQICGKGKVGDPFRCCHVDHDSCVTSGDPCPTTRCDPSPACCVLLSCTEGEQCSAATETCVTFRSTCDGGADARAASDASSVGRDASSVGHDASRAQGTDAAGDDATASTSTDSGSPAGASGSDAASRDGRATDVDGALGGRGAGGRGAGGSSSSHGGSVASGTGGAATEGSGGVPRGAGGERVDGSLGPDQRGAGHIDPSGCGCHVASTAADGRSPAWPLLAAVLVGRGRRRRGPRRV